MLVLFQFNANAALKITAHVTSHPRLLHLCDLGLCCYACRPHELPATAFALTVRFACSHDVSELHAPRLRLLPCYAGDNMDLPLSLPLCLFPSGNFCLLQKVAHPDPRG